MSDEQPKQTPELEHLQERNKKILCELQRMQTILSAIDGTTTLEQAHYLARLALLQTTYFLPMITDCVPIDTDETPPKTTPCNPGELLNLSICGLKKR